MKYFLGEMLQYDCEVNGSFSENPLSNFTSTEKEK